jgi:preprotein translocase subunit Sss1
MIMINKIKASERRTLYSSLVQFSLLLFFYLIISIEYATFIDYFIFNFKCQITQINMMMMMMMMMMISFDIPLIKVLTITRTLTLTLTLTEFAKIARATGFGFLIMGFVGFFVKLIHIPINNIIVGGM